MPRICFINPSDRDNFFRLVKSNSGLSWEGLARCLGTTRTMIDRYRRGKLNVPLERFSRLMQELPFNKRKNIPKMIVTKEDNWGQIIGGKNAYQVNRAIFDINRNKKGAGVKYEFDINIPLSADLCEFLGVIIGDGCTNKYGRLYHTQIAGDKVLDREYYFNNLPQICKNLFGIVPRIIIRPRGIYMNIYSKRVFELLTRRFGIPRGVKCYTVTIPKEILDAGEPMLNFTLRGMFNTDGGVGFDRRKAYTKPYVRVNYTSSSFALIDQIRAVLSKYDIPYSVHKKNNDTAKQIQINGDKNVKIFLEHIGFSNPRHTKKISYLLA